jgi:hypothetical protein
MLAVFTGRAVLASDVVYENAVRIQMQATSVKADVAIWLNCHGNPGGPFTPSICQGFPWPGPTKWLELKGLPVKLNSMAFRLKYMEKASGEKLSELTMGRVFGSLPDFRLSTYAPAQILPELGDISVSGMTLGAAYNNVRLSFTPSTQQLVSAAGRPFDMAKMAEDPTSVDSFPVLMVGDTYLALAATFTADRFPDRPLVMAPLNQARAVGLSYPSIRGTWYQGAQLPADEYRTPYHFEGQIDLPESSVVYQQGEFRFEYRTRATLYLSLAGKSEMRIPWKYKPIIASPVAPIDNTKGEALGAQPIATAIDSALGHVPSDYDSWSYPDPVSLGWAGGWTNQVQGLVDGSLEAKMPGMPYPTVFSTDELDAYGRKPSLAEVSQPWSIPATYFFSKTDSPPNYARLSNPAETIVKGPILRAKAAQLNGTGARKGVPLPDLALGIFSDTRTVSLPEHYEVFLDPLDGTPIIPCTTAPGECRIVRVPVVGTYEIRSSHAFAETGKLFPGHGERCGHDFLLRVSHTDHRRVVSYGWLDLSCQ